MDVVIIAPILLAICSAVYFLNQQYRMRFFDNFTCKSVFITGTDTGFGRKLAIELDNKGLTVFAGCYTSKGEEDLRKIGSNRLKVLSIDISKQNSINDAKEFVSKYLPPGEGLWGLVNNAGIFGNVCFDFCTIEDYKRVMDVNFFGTVMVTEAFLPLIKMSHGRIVTVISIFGRGSIGVVPYCCSKFALEPYCDGLRRSMKSFGVHASIIEPGFFRETQLTEKTEIAKGFEKQWERLPESIKIEYGEEFKTSFFHLFKLSFSLWPFVNQNRMEMVTNAMQHALGAIRPKARYLCGYDARGYVLFTNCLPDWFLDIFARLVTAYRKVAAKV